MNYAKNITDLIGNTPLIRLNTYSDQTDNTILGKCEFLNPSSSVKDRIGYGMITTALQDRVIDKDTTIIEPTSGNTGIALGVVCAGLGLKLILTMPSSMSVERRKLLSALGASLELTDPSFGMKGAINKATELSKNIPNSFIPSQFDNPANPKAHQNTTAQEILEDTKGVVDVFISAVGTGGTITGVGEILKRHNPNIKVIAVEPNLSPVLSGGDPAPHKIQGIGAGFVPKILDTDIYDDIKIVSFEDSVKTSKELAKKEGILVGISAGANAFIAKEVAKEYKNKTIVTILCDTGERYLSTSLYD